MKESPIAMEYSTSMTLIPKRKRLCTRQSFVHPPLRMMYMIADDPNKDSIAEIALRHMNGILSAPYSSLQSLFMLSKWVLVYTTRVF